MNTLMGLLVCVGVTLSSAPAFARDDKSHVKDFFRTIDTVIASARLIHAPRSESGFSERDRDTARALSENTLLTVTMMVQCEEKENLEREQRRRRDQEDDLADPFILVEDAVTDAFYEAAADYVAGKNLSKDVRNEVLEILETARSLSPSEWACGKTASADITVIGSF